MCKKLLTLTEVCSLTFAQPLPLAPPLPPLIFPLLLPLLPPLLVLHLLLCNYYWECTHCGVHVHMYEHTSIYCKLNHITYFISMLIGICSSLKEHSYNFFMATLTGHMKSSTAILYKQNDLLHISSRGRHIGIYLFCISRIIYSWRHLGESSNKVAT